MPKVKLTPEPVPYRCPDGRAHDWQRREQKVETKRTLPIAHKTFMRDPGGDGFLVGVTFPVRSYFKCRNCGASIMVKPKPASKHFWAVKPLRRVG